MSVSSWAVVVRREPVLRLEGDANGLHRILFEGEPLARSAMFVGPRPSNTVRLRRSRFRRSD